jgi:hypothetical protein
MSPEGAGAAAVALIIGLGFALGFSVKGCIDEPAHKQQESLADCMNSKTSACAECWEASR